MLDEVTPEILWIGIGFVVVFGLMILVGFVSTQGDTKKRKEDKDDASACQLESIICIRPVKQVSDVQEQPSKKEDKKQPPQLTKPNTDDTKSTTKQTSSSGESTCKLKKKLLSGEKRSSTTYSDVQRIEKRVCGLYNQGNTCFMNSALQCLTHTSPLREYFLEKKRSDFMLTDLPRSQFEQKNISLVYTNFLDAMWNSNKDVISPTDLKRAIAQITPRFGGRTQEDAQELLMFLLDGLHEDENTIRKKPYIKMAVDEKGKTDKEIAKEWWDKHLLRNNSEIVNIFHGQVRVQITCSKGHGTQMFEAISQLTLPIPQTTGVIQSTPDYQYGNNMHKNSEYSLYDCLELYTQKKKTSSFCEKCNMIASNRKVEIWKMSQIVIIHLKRFTTLGFGHQKVDTMVEFTQSLCLDNFIVNPEEKNYMYDLYAVINHNGGLYYGHYYAFVKHDNFWYRCDDSHVAKMSDQFRDIVTRNAYMLFYQKRKQH